MSICLSVCIYAHNTVCMSIVLCQGVWPQTSFEIKKEPSVAEVEMCEVAILLKMFEHFRVENLQTVRQKLNNSMYMVKKR